MKIIWFLLLAGCSDWSSWGTTEITAAYGPAGPLAEEWTEQVTRGLAAWAEPLEELGCEVPLTMGHGNKVILVPSGKWAQPGAIGVTYDDHIEIKQRDNGLAYDYTVQHELGHALGLDHSDPTFGPSVMAANAKDAAAAVTPNDVLAAACVLGCGVCDANDRYDLK